MGDGKRLADRVALITGACQGIGRAIAQAYAEDGAHLFLVDLREEGLAAAAEEARGAGVRAAFRRADVTDPAQVEAAVAQAEAGLGPLDVLVNCAGIYQSRRFLEYSLEDWNRVLAVNVTGTMLCCQAVLRRMAPRGRGRIINLASVAGRLGGPLRSAYSTSKHAVIGLTRCIAAEFAADGITANAICPGMVDTEMFSGLVAQDAEILGVSERERMLAELLRRSPQQRLIAPREIARLAVYLASPDADGMTGQGVALDGGMSMV
jgi:NAD(P)-dependent dehydrogenase (short-subunit alcohol dehydrogenase family)